MLAALGMFIFDSDSTLFEEKNRRRDWRHASTERFGARAASQFLGPGEDVVSLSGRLVPELVGRYSALEDLADMAATGDAWPLADGQGTILGQFVITSLDEQQRQLIDTGQARQTDFTLELKRVD